MRIARAMFAIMMAAAAAGLLGAQQTSSNAPELPSADAIVSKMVAQGSWQEVAVASYNARRHFDAANPRFKLTASLDVSTRFRAPDRYESVVLKQNGSSIIREHVFDKILDAEKDAQPSKQKRGYDILPDNYVFQTMRVEDCDGRKCYCLSLTPKRKDKYLLEGFVWVDAQDYAIVRIQGSPSKRPSIWTKSTEITRTYKQVGGVWMTDRIDSASDLVFAGHSTLSIQYAYDDVQMNGGASHQTAAQ